MQNVRVGWGGNEFFNISIKAGMRQQMVSELMWELLTHAHVPGVASPLNQGGDPELYIASQFITKTNPS